MRLLPAALALSIIATASHAAEPYPNRPIRMIVPLPPGTASDFLARTLAQPLSEKYRQQVVVDNRPGAGGLLGSTIVSKATPDGYTFAMVAPPHLVGPLMQSKPPYDALRDFVAVVEVASIPNLIVVSPGTPAKSVQELVALAKAKPGQLNYASAGVGTLAHIAGEIFKQAAGINTVHVPFKLISDAFAEMLSDRVHYLIFTIPSAAPMVRDGKLRAIAVTSDKRSSAFPDLPTVAEAGLPAAKSDGWFGIVAPAGTPRAIVDRMQADVTRLVAEPRIREAFARMGAEPALDSSRGSFARLLDAEYVRFQKLVKDVGLQTQ